MNPSPNPVHKAYLAKSQQPRRRLPGTRVITYGTFDLLHAGHIDQLQRARALGTYLIAAILTDVFDAGRGKRFLAQNVLQRAEGVRATGLVDEVVLEECDDKINNVLKYHVNVVAVFDSWEGPQAYVENLRRYCEVVCVPEAEGQVSSTALRGTVRVGVVGAEAFVEAAIAGGAVTSGVDVVAAFVKAGQAPASALGGDGGIRVCSSAEQLYAAVVAVYVVVPCEDRAIIVREALEAGKHVLCATPISASQAAAEALFALAAEKNLVLMESVPSAFTPAMERLTAIAQNGKIGRILSVSINITAPLSNNEPCHTPLCLDLLSEALLPTLRILHARPIHALSARTHHPDTTPSHLTTLALTLDSNTTASLQIGHNILLPETLLIIGSEGYLTADSWRTTSRFHLQFRDVNFEEASAEQDFEFATRRGGYRFDFAEFAGAVRLGRAGSHMFTAENSVAIAGVLERALAGVKGV